MKISRSTLYLPGAFALAFIAITVIKSGPDQQASEKVSRLSDVKKTQIAQFWDLYRSASAYRQAGDVEQAASTYRQALQLDKRHEDTWYYLGNVLTRLGKFNEALDAFQQLSAINPLRARAHFQAGTILSDPSSGTLFDLDAAEQEFQRTFEINREESEPLLRLSEIAVAKGAFDLAETYLTDTLRMNPKAVTGYCLLGYIRWRNEDHIEARKLFKTARLHSQTEEQTNGVLGEGDTLDGVRLDRGRRSLFSPFVDTVLADETEPTDQQINTVYRQLDHFCKDVSERWMANRQAERE